jgi:ubiquinone/menaquinone biosynthesis C-methylase UbiE
MQAAQKAYKGLAMEGAIATWYAKNTARDQRRFTDTARAIAERVPPGGRILEVAPGPGYLAIELAKRGYAVTAMDISCSFVRMARKNAADANVALTVEQGNASAMPFPDSTFDYVVCMAAFKNFTDPVGAINEMHRVLRPGGHASIYDLRKDARADEISAEVRDMRLSNWNALLTRLIFRFGLLRAAYTREQLGQMAARSRFGACEIVTAGIGFELRLTRR